MTDTSKEAHMTDAERTYKLEPFAGRAASGLAHSGYSFVEYTPGDATAYRLLLALGPRPHELTVAWPGLRATATFPLRRLHVDDVADKMFRGTGNEVYEHRHGPVTAFLNAVVAHLAAVPTPAQADG